MKKSNIIHLKDAFPDLNERINVRNYVKNVVKPRASGSPVNFFLSTAFLEVIKDLSLSNEINTKHLKLK
jgi:hypothetical protein